MTKTQLAGLDLLRFLAAFYIVVFHLGIHFSQAPLTLFFSRGPSATSLFFILSGFLLTTLYGRRPLDYAEQQRFIWRRATRILPPYLIGLGLMLVVQRFMYLPSSDVLMFLTMTQTWFVGSSHLLNVPAWSASCLMFFYLTFPVALKFWQRRSTPMLLGSLAGLWLLGMGMANVLVQHPLTFNADVWALYLHNNPLMRWPEFMLGMVTALLIERRAWTWRPRPALLWAGSGSVFLAMALLPRDTFAADNGIFAPLSLLLLLTALSSGERLSPWLNRIRARQIANSTLVLYMIHQPVQIAFRTLWKEPVLSGWHIAVYLCCVLILSVLIDHSFCRPVTRWLQTLSETNIALPRLPVVFRRRRVVHPLRHRTVQFESADD
ncbi:acyltransferase (plasmid) [Deinococcus sp. KNUC1210]|uniref:acyltransferase family protein n=1 Tax=Deinococcus sp. KNUC1210 TaxID=2917691 RepID=UPI001EF0676F|nr:acyltransferase [Deinococcus sp. KNUC1210]ULH17488.1 acyltransferase [Deinococcus sp. KNUC1210]